MTRLLSLHQLLHKEVKYFCSETATPLRPQMASLSLWPGTVGTSQSHFGALAFVTLIFNC